MTSIHRTAYPRFRRSVPAKELQESFTPSGPEIEWARERTRTLEHLLALLLLLKAFQRLGCFPDLFEVPLPVVDHIRGILGLGASVVAEHASSRTGERHRGWVRDRLQVVFDPPAAEQLARQVISDAALSKDNPADLINVALERLIAHRFELPGYTTLDESVDLSFVSDAWRKILRPRRQPTKLVRRHFEVCVFSYLAAELRVGDIAVTGSESYANLQDQLLSWQECQPLITGYCAEIGLPAKASAFRQMMETQLTSAAEAVDVGFPDNADLVIDHAGQPILKRRRGNARRPSALALEQTVLARLPERSLLDVVARVAHWTGWPRHLGPVSGSDPKIRDAFGRYVLLTFAYGANLGPYQMSRHMGGLVSPHQLATALAHAGPARIDAARTDVVNAYAQLDLPRLWGDGSHAAADGSQIDTWADNLLAETHIRYGGVGGLAYRHIADNYIALFTHFIPCGVWEAIYIIEGLLRNASDLQPTSIHADTQGQSLPVFGLAPLLGFDLLPRIRNWKDLILYRPNKNVQYRHIDALFDPDKSINWSLIETHWPDLLRVVLSIRAGKISSVALLRRLGHDSRKNKLYRAFRELGRVTRTIVLLRYLSDPALRDSIAIITNRMESYNGFCQWLSFGSDVLADNDPEHQEKLVKFNELLANSLIFSTTLDITAVANTLATEGVPVHRDDLATISPYITSKTRRFGDWALDLTPPPALLGDLDLPDELELEEGPQLSGATSGN